MPADIVRYLTHPQVQIDPDVPVLLCQYAGHAVDRVHDQPAGGGNIFAFARETRQVLHGWRRMDDPDLPSTH
ncbi:hypothetical protein [Bradyrhizobium sp. CCBAU 53338]|uniref:hypothetical protein n=1 Tax=Bradyrhizobium sp. CCBAU 53338 TaxID=1325111 RepID=UPI00188AD432|nr:hypothetical protein [Bradyrhizobium sp. CCBAU 53338]QOZ51274.1 hypothetical protein XH90_07670 [Bradyrhizobium sp. CCBAU 53338]